jgi:hypothetical protein
VHWQQLLTEAAMKTLFALALVALALAGGAATYTYLTRPAHACNGNNC